MELEQQEYIDMKKEDALKVDALIAKTRNTEFPDLFQSRTTMSLVEEQKILSMVKYRKSDMKVVISQGSMCRCGHGKVKHLADSSNSYRAGECSLKTCGCVNYCKPKYN